MVEKSRPEVGQGPSPGPGPPELPGVGSLAPAAPHESKTLMDIWSGLIIAGVSLGWLVSLLAVRLWTKRQVLRQLTTMSWESEEVPLPFSDLRPEDRQALELVREYRRRYLLKLAPETDFTFRSLLNLAMDLTQQIAAVYHPGEERPELHASLAQLLNLQIRIGVKLQGLLETLPLQAFKNIKLQTILQCHDLYKFCLSHPAYRFVRDYHLDKVGRWLWLLKNLVNPWYWGRRLAYTGGKELLTRYFWGRAISIVGLEAIRLYSGRAPGEEGGRLYDLAWQELQQLTADDPVLATKALQFYFRLVLHSRELPETTKLRLLQHASQPLAGQPETQGMVSPAERRQIEKWLRPFIRQELPAPERPVKLQQLRRRLAERTTTL